MLPWVYTEHAADQMQARGITCAMVQRLIHRRADIRHKGALVVERSKVIRHNGQWRRVCVLLDTVNRQIVTAYWRGGG